MIDDDVLAARIPRLGTITTGYGQEATARSGSTYSRPTRSKTLVFHTNDPEIANAVQMLLGGDLSTDSTTWEYDVVTDARQVDVTILASGFRQALELWRAAECVRRCDGVTMSTENGRPVSKPCVCDREIADGSERACSPSTILPALIDLDVERFGVWEIRSSSWGTAAAIKGTIRALAMVGVGTGSVPARLAMVDRTVRDGEGKVHDVVELHLTIAQSQETLSMLAGSTASTVGLPAPASLPSGDERVRLDLLTRWTDLHARANRAKARDALAKAWRRRHGPGKTVEDLALDDLATWVDAVAVVVSEYEDASDVDADAPLPADDRPAAAPPPDEPADA
ncbi:MAG: hypothetical protein ABR616_10325 [Dermatophilaceae bacterium]